MTNRDLAIALANKYAPNLRVVFVTLNKSGLNTGRSIRLDEALIDHASPTFVKIVVAHELGHLVDMGHGPNWHNAVKGILVAEGLEQYADPKYYLKTQPDKLWKYHFQREIEKGRPRWPKKLTF